MRGVAALEIIVSGALLGSMLGCLDTDELAILGAAAGPLVRTSREGTKTRGKASAVDPEIETNPVPRLVYRASDMALNPCMRLDEAGALVGKNCPGGFVVFGPYASVSWKSVVKVRFEVESDDELVVSGDVVSNMGKQQHGELGSQTVSPDAKRPLSYRAQLEEGGEAVEARIFVRGEDDAAFRISNFEIAVHERTR